MQTNTMHVETKDINFTGGKLLLLPQHTTTQKSAVAAPKSKEQATVSNLNQKPKSNTAARSKNSKTSKTKAKAPAKTKTPKTKAKAPAKAKTPKKATVKRKTNPKTKAEVKAAAEARAVAKAKAAAEAKAAADAKAAEEERKEKLKGEMIFDSFERQFQSFPSLMEAIDVMESESRWIPNVIANQIRIGCVESPLDMQEYLANGMFAGVNDDALYDTVSRMGSSLYAVVSGESSTEYLLRSTVNINSTADIHGGALNKLQTSDYCNVINMCLTVAKGEALFLERSHKITAILSDNGNGYEILPMSNLSKILVSKLEKDFGTPSFLGGYLSHEIMSCVFTLPKKQGEIMKKYQEVSSSNGTPIFGADYMPAVRFLTSDIGRCAATVIPCFLVTNKNSPIYGSEITFTEPIRVTHKKNTAFSGLERFSEKTDDLFALFEDMNRMVEELTKITIEYPTNAFIGLCKRVHIGKKLASSSLELLEQFTDGGSCNANDLFVCLSNIVGQAKKKEMGELQISDLSEKIGKALKCLSISPQDYDVAGTVAWN